MPRFVVAATSRKIGMTRNVFVNGGSNNRHQMGARAQNTRPASSRLFNSKLTKVA